MSLEQAIQANTAAIERLIAVMQSGTLPTGSPAAEPTTTGTRRGRKAATTAETSAGSSATSDTTGTSEASTSASTAAAGSEVNDGKTVAANTGTDDSAGTGTPGNRAADGKEYLAPGVNNTSATRYIHIPAHNTVAAIKPGELIPNIAGTLEITEAQYTTLKAQYSVPLQAVGSGSTSAAAPAATPSATPASSPSPAASPAADGPKVMELCKALHARDGNDSLRTVLEKFKVGRVGDLVAKSELHAEAIPFIENLLKPAVKPAVSADLF